MKASIQLQSVYEASGCVKNQQKPGQVKLHLGLEELFSVSNNQQKRQWRIEIHQNEGLSDWPSRIEMLHSKHESHFNPRLCRKWWVSAESNSHMLDMCDVCWHAFCNGLLTVFLHRLNACLQYLQGSSNNNVTEYNRLLQWPFGGFYCTSQLSSFITGYWPRIITGELQCGCNDVCVFDSGPRNAFLFILSNTLIFNQKCSSKRCYV